MTWWIPLIAPTATFIASHLPPLPGFEPVPEITDEEYVLVDHDAYLGVKSQPIPRPEPKSTDEVLAEERRRHAQEKEKQRGDAGIVVARRQGVRRDGTGAAGATGDEKLADLMHRIDKEIVESYDDPFNWRWFTTADLRNRDIYIYNKRRLLIENHLEVASEAAYFLPLGLGRDTSRLDQEIRTLDMARQALDRRFVEKYDYIPPRSTWARPGESAANASNQRKRKANIAVLKGVLTAAYGLQIPF